MIKFWKEEAEWDPSGIQQLMPEKHMENSLISPETIKRDRGPVAVVMLILKTAVGCEAKS